MLPAEFQESHPTVARVLAAMVAGEELPERLVNTDRKAVQTELDASQQAEIPWSPISKYIWEEVGGSLERFMTVSTQAYAYLGVGESVRCFMAQLWSSVSQSWTPPERKTFLRQIVDAETRNRFEALDFAFLLFREVSLESSFVIVWLRDLQAIGGGDLSHRGLDRCLENYAEFNQSECVKVLRELSPVPPSDRIKSLLASMLHWMRQADDKEKPNQDLIDLETELRRSSRPHCREIFLDSWAWDATNGKLTEQQALEFREEFIEESDCDTPQLKCWSHLLVLAMNHHSAWGWVYRELRSLVKRSLGESVRQQVAYATLAGWEGADANSPVGQNEWENLFFSLHPIAKTEAQIWGRLEGFMAENLQAHPTQLEKFIVRQAETSGDSWRRLFAGVRDPFSHFSMSLVEAGRGNVVTTLCLSPIRDARRVGLQLFNTCGLESLDQDIISQATAEQLELIILELACEIRPPALVARIHASLAECALAFGGVVSELYLEEVATEGNNTHTYREELKLRIKDCPKVLEVLQKVEDGLDNTIAATKSPALQMRVPGHHRAEQLSHRRMARQINISAEKYSIFASFVTTVQVLYSHEWQSLLPDGTLSPPSQMTKHSTSMEFPRLETLTPQTIQIRRLAANARIEELDQSEDASS